MAWEVKKSGAGSAGKLDSVTGIGEETFFIHGTAPGGSSATTLMVRKGTSDFVLHANGFKTEPLAAMKQVAARVASEL